MKYGLIGEKLVHSLSKKIYELCGYNYDLLEVKPTNLGNVLRDKTLTNFNVTIPYKKDIIPMLDVVSSEAMDIGAVNTVMLSEGKWYGYNTDIYGMKMALQKARINLKDKAVMILGTGGTSNTASYLAKVEGAKSIIKVGRNSSTNYENCYNLHEINVIINATPVGMYPNNHQSSIDLTRFKNLTGVFDAVYNPLCTNLIMQAKKLNINCSGGLYMLVAQAVKSMAIFNNKEADLVLIDKIYRSLVLQFRNIVLIGMPSSGKSTIGEGVAKLLGKKFVDLDLSFAKVYRLKPAEEIIKNGEESFRNKETEIIKGIIDGGLVVATGGGSVLREENIDFLKQNGFVVYLDRDVSKLSCEGRPLSIKNGIEELYKIRKPLYEKYADVIVKNDNIDVTIREVVKKYEESVSY